jgi:hypothetical protein
VEALGEASSHSFEKRMASLSGELSCHLHAVEGHNSGAADRRPDEAWGSFPGRSAARNFFWCPINFSLSLPREGAWLKASDKLKFIGHTLSVCIGLYLVSIGEQSGWISLRSHFVQIQSEHPTGI